MSETSKIDSLLRLIVLLQQDQAGNASQLAGTLGVVNRTVHRYLEALRELGVPWYFDAEAKRYRISREFFLPPVHLTPAEAIALIALGKNVAGREQIPLTRPVSLAIEKIRGQLNDRVLREIEDQPDHIHIQLAAGSDADSDQLQDIYDDVALAIRRRRKLRCCYDGVGKASDSAWFYFQPYKLWFEQRAWYAVGLREDRGSAGEIRNLKLNRFVAVEHTDLPYGIPDDFSIEAHRGDAWRMVKGGRTYDVAVRFAREVADTVTDTRWHHTQQDFDGHDDGSVTFHCRVDGLDEICHWVLAYGEKARVLHPPELADRVAVMARATAHLYQSDMHP